MTSTEDFNLFVFDYIAECGKKDITSQKDIIALAKEEIAQIEQELAQVDLKKERLSKLQAVCLHLGDTSLKQKRAVGKVPKVNLDDDSPEALELRKKICDVIESQGSLTNREVINRVGSYEEDRKVYAAIKWLGSEKILKRDGSEANKLVKGENWDKRP